MKALVFDAFDAATQLGELAAAKDVEYPDVEVMVFAGGKCETLRFYQPPRLTWRGLYRLAHKKVGTLAPASRHHEALARFKVTGGAKADEHVLPITTAYVDAQQVALFWVGAMIVSTSHCVHA